MLGHELRNPLGAIVTSLHLVERSGGAQGPAGAAWAIVRRQTSSLSRLVEDLLDVTRISTGKVELRKRQVDVGVAVRQAVENTRHVMESQRHQVSLHIVGGPLFVEADETRLEQVLGNLLHDAAKYTEPGGRVTVSAARAGDEVLIRVADTGIGIPSELLPRIFDLFAQSAGARTRAGGGLGLGLSLVKTLVERHGGTLEARSDGPGKGSEFIVRLPAREGAVAPPRERETPGRRAAPRLRVLLVDDNRDLAASLAEVLRGWGHEVAVEHEARASVARALSTPPDLMLVDIGLPGIDGHEVARRVRAGLSGGVRIRLVAVTRYGQPEDRRRALEAGFDEHVKKPVEVDVLDRVLGETAAMTMDAPVAPPRDPAGDARAS